MTATELHALRVGNLLQHDEQGDVVYRVRQLHRVDRLAELQRLSLLEPQQPVKLVRFFELRNRYRRVVLS